MALDVRVGGLSDFLFGYFVGVAGFYCMLSRVDVGWSGILRLGAYYVLFVVGEGCAVNYCSMGDVFYFEEGGEF